MYFIYTWFYGAFCVNHVHISHHWNIREANDLCLRISREILLKWMLNILNQIQQYVNIHVLLRRSVPVIGERTDNPTAWVSLMRHKWASIRKLSTGWFVGVGGAQTNGFQQLLTHLDEPKPVTKARKRPGWHTSQTHSKNLSCDMISTDDQNCWLCEYYGISLRVDKYASVYFVHVVWVCCFVCVLVLVLTSRIS